MKRWEKSPPQAQGPKAAAGRRPPPRFGPAVSQPKPAREAGRPPTAPPAYRPPPAPKVLQPKAGLVTPPRAGGPPARPAAPPVYKPERKGAVQPKLFTPPRKAPAAPPVYRPEARTGAPPKLPAGRPPQAPPAGRPAPNSLQPKLAPAPAREAGRPKVNARPAPPPTRPGPTAVQLKAGTQRTPPRAAGAVIQCKLRQVDKDLYEWETPTGTTRFFRFPETGIYEKLAGESNERTGQFFQYYEKADLMKTSPPPPQPGTGVVVSNNNNTPAPLDLPDETWRQLDAPLIQGAYLGRLPEDLSQLLSGKLQVTKYVEASIGVYFVTNHDLRTTFVVKPFRDGEQVSTEYLASRIAASLGIPHPDTRYLPANSAAGKKLLECLGTSHLFRSNTLGRWGEPTHFLLMTEVEGLAVNKLVVNDNNNGTGGGSDDPATLLRSLVGDPGHLRAVLDNIGQLAAFDIFLFYDDRTGFVPDAEGPASNWGNAMAYAQGGQVKGLAAIDQSVRVEYSKAPAVAESPKPSLFQLTDEDDEESALFGPSGKKPQTTKQAPEQPKKHKQGIEEIKAEVERLLRADRSLAQNIWAELPAPLKRVFAEDLFKNNDSLAVEEIRQSIIKGLKLLTFRVTESVLNQVFLELERELGGALADKMKAGLLKSLKVIKKKVG